MNLKEQLKKYDITQAQCARKIGVSRQFINCVCNKERPLPKDHQEILNKWFIALDSV